VKLDTGLVLALVALAFVLLILIGGDLGYWAGRVWRVQRQHRRWLRKPSLSLSLPFSGARRQGPLQAKLWEIRDFLVGLQLALSLEESLVGALNQMAEQFADQSVFGQRLMSHVQSKAAISPEEVLKGLAEDFQSEQLRDAMTRLTLAREGGMSYARAMTLSVEAVEHEIRAEVEQEIQRAPIALLIPMAVGVFLPGLVLAIYPLVTRVIRDLAL
jgi:hypothetical protein